MTVGSHPHISDRPTHKILLQPFFYTIRLFVLINTYLFNSLRYSLSQCQSNTLAPPASLKRSDLLPLLVICVHCYHSRHLLTAFPSCTESGTCQWSTVYVKRTRPLFFMYVCCCVRVSACVCVSVFDCLSSGLVRYKFNFFPFCHSTSLMLPYFYFTVH